MVSGVILSYNNDPTLHAVPYHIARELKNYQLLAIRYLFGCFHKKQNGIILNEDYGMGFPLQMVSFLSTFKSDTLGEDSILIITAEDNIGLWKQYISEYTEFKVVNLSTYDEKTIITHGTIILGTDVEFKKAVTLKDSEYFMVIIEGLENVITMRAMKGLQGIFHVGFTHRNFYKEKDLKLMWQMLKWAEPSAIGKFNDFSEEYNDCILSMIEPFQEIWFRITWNFCDSFEKPPVEELDLNTTKERSTEKRRSSTKKRKSSEFKTSTTKKRRSNEIGQTSKRQHSNFQEQNISFVSNTSASPSVHSSTTLSTEEKNSSNEQRDSEIDSSRRENDISYDSLLNSSKKSDESPRKTRTSLKRMCPGSPDQGIEFPEVIINSKVSSPKKEAQICNTLKCSPRRNKRRCSFGSTSFTPGSIIGLFEEYYEKNIDTPGTVGDNSKTLKDENNEDKSSTSDFSLSLDDSPKTTENNSDDNNGNNKSSVNDSDFSLKTKLPTNNPDTSNDDLVSSKMKYTIRDIIKTLKDQDNDEDESSSNDLALSLDTSPKTTENNCDDDESSVTDFSLSLDLSPQINHLEEAPSTKIKHTTNGIESSDDFLSLVYNKSIKESKDTAAMRNLENSSPLPKPDKGIQKELSVNNNSRCNALKLYSPFNNEPSTSSKNIEPIHSITENNVKNIQPKPSTSKSNEDVESNKGKSSMKKGKTFGKHKSVNAVMENLADEAEKNSNKQSNVEKKTFGKHKSARAIMERITDEAVIKEFSSSFFESSKETQKFLRKTKSDTNLTPKIKVIDKHVLEEFARDFPMKPLPRMSILRGVKDFFEGEENKAGPSNRDSSVGESPENIWSLFRKGDQAQTNSVPPADDNSVINSIVEGTSISSSIRSVYSQETQIIDKKTGDDCLDCSGKNEKVAEFCVKCNNSVAKEDKSTQSDFDETPGAGGNKSDDIFAIFNSCDTPEIAGGERRNGAYGNTGTEERVSLASFFGDEKKSIRRKNSREDVLSSIFGDYDESGGNLLNEDKDDDFNDLDLWSVSIEGERSKRVQSEILQTLFGE